MAPNEEPFFSIQLNTDGFPVFHSSKKSLWPILCTVIEQNKEKRKNNLILAGLWCHYKKPSPSPFFNNLITELKSLATDGL